MTTEQTIDTAKSLQRIQNYIERLEIAKGYHKECIHAFIGKDGEEISLLVADLKALLQQVAATHPTQQGLEQFIEQAGDVHFQRCRVGSKEGEIRWDIEFGHYGAEVRGKTLREAIVKAMAAQAKQRGAA